MDKYNLCIFNDCISQCEDISTLFDTDYTEISECLKGDILEKYREVLRCEEDVLKKIQRNLLKYKGI